MMEKQVLLTIVSRQRFMDQEPEETKLVTEGTMRQVDGVIEIAYPETELTGLLGTTTTFRVEGDRVHLLRSGAVQSKMSFIVGTEDRSLYDMGFGALMIAVRTERISVRLGDDGGSLSVGYAISIEDETSGFIDYDIQVRVK